jgi:hypothetical protein
MKPSSPAAAPANEAARQRFMSMMNEHLSELLRLRAARAGRARGGR